VDGPFTKTKKTIYRIDTSYYKPKLSILSMVSIHCVYVCVCVWVGSRATSPTRRIFSFRSIRSNRQNDAAGVVRASPHSHDDDDDDDDDDDPDDPGWFRRVEKPPRARWTTGSDEPCAPRNYPQPRRMERKRRRRGDGTTRDAERRGACSGRTTMDDDGIDDDDEEAEPDVDGDDGRGDDGE